MRITLWTTILLLATVASTSPAYANAEAPATQATASRAPADPWKNHAVQLNFGLGSPVGFVGIVYATPALDRLWLQAGVGLGQSGLLLSVMPRFAIYKGQACHLGIGVGGAMGISALASYEQPGPVTAWLDVDVFNVECRGANRGVFSFGLGFSMRVSEEIPSDDDGMPDLENGGPQFHVGFGPAF